MPRIEFPEKGDPVFVHTCSIGERRTVLRSGPDGWQRTGPDSLSPSVHCQECGTHGWWTDGEWKAC